MDASLLEDLMAKNQPLRIETASGRVFDVPHRDFHQLLAEEDDTLDFL